jgi:hypothetical protein
LADNQSDSESLITAKVENQAEILVGCAMRSIITACALDLASNQSVGTPFS